MAMFTHGVKKLLYEFTSVILTSSETFSLILLINKVSVVIVISKTFKFEKRSQYKSNYFFPPRAVFLRGKYDARRLQNKERMKERMKVRHTI